MTKWISVKDRLPEKDQIVDVWCQKEGRHTDYKYITNYKGQKGNNFFEVQGSGRSIIRMDEYDPATNWMPVPKPPEELLMINVDKMISIKDREPESGIDILVFDGDDFSVAERNGAIYICKADGNSAKDYLGDMVTTTPTHWTYLK